MLLLLLLLVTVAAALWRAPAPGVDDVPLAAPLDDSRPLPAPEVTTDDAVAPPPAESVAAEAAPPAKAVVPFRASASQRAEDIRRAASETDLPAFAAELEARANAGDADAAWALAGLYQSCAAALQFAEEFEKVIGDRTNLLVMGYSETETDAIQVNTEQQIRRCSAFTAPLATTRSKFWQTRALATGHPGALLAWQPKPRQSPDTSAIDAYNLQMRNAGVEVLQDGDPLDLARYSDQLSMHSRYESASWLLASCNLLAECARDPGSYAAAMDPSLFLVGLSNSFFNLRHLSPRARLIVEAQSREILLLWRARRFGDLMAGRPPITAGPGG